MESVNMCASFTISTLFGPDGRTPVSVPRCTEGHEIACPVACAYRACPAGGCPAWAEDPDHECPAWFDCGDYKMGVAFSLEEVRRGQAHTAVN